MESSSPCIFSQHNSAWKNRNFGWIFKLCRSLRWKIFLVCYSKQKDRYVDSYTMAKCHGCTLVINQSYWFEILQTIIKSFEGWGHVIIFLLLELTTLVFSVSISSVHKSLLRGCIHCILPCSICRYVCTIRSTLSHGQQFFHANSKRR